MMVIAVRGDTMAIAATGARLDSPEPDRIFGPSVDV
jgi:hypothetical protein